MMVYPPPPPEPAPLEAPAPIPPPADTPAPRVYPLTFAGNAKEYFRIWIVNLFLSIVTLGIYSPWAKVRKKRYLYGNTWLAGANFEYHGNPVAILKGRVVAVLALVAYNVAGHYVPKLGTAILLLLMLGAPWLIVRSMQFNAQNSSYRNLRFHFHGRYGEGLRAIAPLLLTPILILVLPSMKPGQVPQSGSDFWFLFLPSLPIVLFYPYVVAAVRRMQVRNSAYGSATFHFSARTRTFYLIYFLAGLIFLGAMTLGGLAVGATFFIPGAIWITMPLMYMVAVSFSFGYTRTRVANLTFNRALVGGRVHFVSTLSAFKLGWIYFGNLFAIVLSLGMLVPWAVVRTASYRAASLRAECADDLEGFLGAISNPVGATGEQLGEFFDVDLSL